MEKTVSMRVIGSVGQKKGTVIKIDGLYREGLKGLAEFSHLLVLWVFDKAPWDGKTLVMPPVYRKLTHDIGTFATRSPFRPSPIAVSSCRILSVNEKAGLITVDWLDAGDDSPVVDIKLYHPSEDTVRDLVMLAWCAHWPRCREDSGDFDWEAEFTFG